MIEIWMKNHLVSDDNCKSIMLIYIYQGITNNVRFTFNDGDTA